MISAPGQPWLTVGVLLACLAIHGSSARGAEAVDPLVRSIPSQRPPLRELLMGEQYETRYAAAVKKLGDWSKWSDSQAPVLGMRLNGVFPGGQVQGVVEPGDVLTHFDGKLLWGDSIPVDEQPHELKYYSAAANALRTMRLQPGKLGVEPLLSWRPELLYLRSKNRDPAWDELMLVGIMNRGVDPDLAETVLARAVRAGHPQDEVTDQIAAEIALMQNRPAVASEFAWFAEQALDPQSDAVSRLLLFRVAIANYHLEDALRLVEHQAEMLEELHPAALKQLIALHKSRPEGERALPPPSERAHAMYADPLIPRLMGSDRPAAVTGIPLLRKGEPLKLDAPTAYTQTYLFEPAEATPNLDFTTEFSGTPDGTALNVQLRWLYVALHAQGATTESSDPLYRDEMVKLAISEFGDVQLLFGNTQDQFTFIDPSASGLSGESHRLRVVRVGGQVEVFLNGHRIYYGPVPDDAPQVQFEFTVNGSKSQVKFLEAVELIERK